MSSVTSGGLGAGAELGAGQGVKRPLEEGERGGGGGGGEAEQGGKKYKPDLASLPTRQYLDQTVVPILLQVRAYSNH